MRNSEIINILREISEYLEMKDVAFKPRAYEKAAEGVETLGDNVASIYEKGGIKAIEEIPGVGKSIAEKIEEFIKTGKIKDHKELKKEIPVELSELRKVEGLGPKTIKTLYDKLKVKNLKDLEKAVNQNKIRELEGFGEKSEENLKKGLEFINKSGKRFIFAYVEPLIEDIAERLRGVKGAEKVVVAGSYRRRKETMGDVDILVVSDISEPIMDYFTTLPEVARILVKGETKSSVRFNNGMDADLRVVPKESYGAALNYFTGSKDHNVALRELAIKKGMKLNEYGLYKGSKQVAGKTEEELYKALGLVYVLPELRENTGEIELAAKDNIPKIIGYGDLKGDLQIQTKWTDGKNTISEMAEYAIKAGLEYIAITDHTKSLSVTNGLDVKRLKEQMKEIDAVNKRLEKRGEKFRVLKGSECDILKNGDLDLPDEILRELDVVGISVHSHFNLSREDQTKRIKKAMSNKYAHIFFHPTGRLINKRSGYDVDLDEIISHAKETGTILEINAFPDRADLADINIRKCVEAGIKMSISSDSHLASHIDYLKYGISQARRGWAKKSDIINAWPVEKMLKFLK